ncbi:hypothetical protein ABEB36_006908 [Hypothenemus hampei]|uniref:Fatty acyl-CoA reductase n=1 Tax=Hypothenemus hampei TaxID=57062 RepID=A0ABD1ESX7_HYPHA
MFTENCRYQPMNNGELNSHGPYYMENEPDVHYDLNELDLTPIQKFYDGAHIFVTGATGFLGKLLVEKLLRSCPTISTLYLLVREKKGKNMDERIDAMFDDVIFKKMKKEVPKYRHKVIGIAGDCVKEELDLSIQDRKLLSDEVNIIFHVAATVRFDEKINIATAINVRSVKDLLKWACKMPNLKSFIHVSTIYSNCLQSTIEEKTYPPAIETDKLIKLIENCPEEILEHITPKLLGNYPNTYAFTKQVAESIVVQESENLPVGIFRPAIVISTKAEPLPGWINNFYGPTGVMAGSGVGLLRVLHSDPQCNANLVPADMCVNSLIVSAKEVADGFLEAQKNQKQYELPVYNYGSTNDNPLTWSQFRAINMSLGLTLPTTKAIWYPIFVFVKFYPLFLFVRFFLHTVPAFFADIVLIGMGRKPRLLAAYRKINKFSSVISHFATKEWKLQTDRIQLQQASMSKQDRELFFCNIKQLNWFEYFKVYIHGIRMYILQDPLETLEKAKMRQRMFYVAHQILTILTVILVLWFTHLLIKLIL